MPPQAPATLPADFFSKMPPDTLPANFDFSGSTSAPSKPQSAFLRFMTRATGLPVSDIAAHPGAYLNPFSSEYWRKGQEQNSQPVMPPTAQQMRSGQLGQDLVDKNFAGAAGDLVPAVMTVGGLAASRFSRMPQPLPPMRMPMAMPEVAAEAAPGSFQGLKPQAAVTPEATPQPASAETPTYPEGIQPRPVDRAEILDGKLAQERAQQDMGLQAYRLARIRGQESAPAPKWQQVAQAQADLVREQAEAKAQEILANAEKAASTVKLTKMPKAKVATAPESQPITQGLDANQDLTDILQRSLDMVKARKGNK